MRDLKTLYLILHALMLKKDMDYQFGICQYILNLKSDNLITKSEYGFLIYDFKSRKPNIFSKFWWISPMRSKYAYWWPLTKEGYYTRLKFIERIISRL